MGVVAILFGVGAVRAQSPQEMSVITEAIVVDGDTIPHIRMRPVHVFSRRVDFRRYQRLVAAVKKVYPIAQTAKYKLYEMESTLHGIESKGDQREYVQGVYDQIKEEYTPVLKTMTRTQGIVLLKLINRETEETAFDVLKEFKGGFVAGFWQGVSRVFGQNLKSEYDKQEDQVLEQIIVYYEAGLL